MSEAPWHLVVGQYRVVGQFRSSSGEDASELALPFCCPASAPHGRKSARSVQWRSRPHTDGRSRANDRLCAGDRLARRFSTSRDRSSRWWFSSHASCAVRTARSVSNRSQSSRSSIMHVHFFDASCASRTTGEHSRYVESRASRPADDHGQREDKQAARTALHSRRLLRSRTSCP